MPNYTYGCESCSQDFELFFYIKDYCPNPVCINCGSKKTYRLYCVDILTQSTSIKKSDSELKTIGDLAQRNSDRMSEDEKISLYNKHNKYKEEKEKNELPKGMSRIKKPDKIKWPGSKNKIKRRAKKK